MEHKPTSALDSMQTGIRLLKAGEIDMLLAEGPFAYYIEARECDLMAFGRPINTMESV